MAKLIISDAARSGIQGITKTKPKYSKEYQRQMDKADKRIEEEHFRYAKAYKKAATYLAR